MKRHAKASSAGSTSGTGSSRRPFGRAFAVRGAAGDADGGGAPSHRRGTSAILGLLLALALTAAPTAFAANTKVVTGTIGAGAGSGNGQLSGAIGVAVNQNGIGGATAGDVYVVDATNNRISQFSASGAFIRSFGQDVVSSGPDNVTPASAKQSVEVPAAVTAGTFVLGFSGATTGGTGTATLTEASNAVTGLITAKGTGNLKTGSFTIAGVTTSSGKFLVGQPIAGSGIPAGAKITAVNGTSLTLSAAITTQGTGVEISSKGPLPFTVGEAVSGTGIPAGTTITATGEGTLTLSAPVEAGQSAVGVTLTANLPYNATSTTVQTALTALGTIGTGNATVTGGPGATAPYAVTFAGALKEAPMPLITANSAGLTGGSVVVAATTTGVSPYEICNAASDTCKVGVAGSLAGALNEAQGVAIDQANGNLYVTNNTSKRVGVYSATGAFQGAFGWKVNASAPAEELQFCTYTTGCATGTAGAAAGQLSTLINSLPAVSPLNGHLYLPDPGNQRVDEFVPTLNGSKEVTAVSFDHAFGRDVIPAINEKQTVTLSGATAGSFALTFNGKTTGASGTGSVTAGSTEITGVSASTGTFIVGEAISGPGIPAGATIVGANIGVLSISASATATSAAAPLTAALPFNATASTVQNALRALATVGGSNATVSGGPAGTAALTVEFGGALAGIDQPQMTADASGLSGTTPTATVATVVDGANGTGVQLEQCTAATTCKVGVVGEAPGGVLSLGGFAPSSPTSIAVSSTGAVYVVSEKSAGGACTTVFPCRVQKFNSAGTTVEEFAPAQLNALGLTGKERSDTSVAIDPGNGHIFVAKKVSMTNSKIFEFFPGGTLVSTSPLGEGSFTGTVGLAAGSGERLYFGGKILGPAPAPKAVSIEPVIGAGATTATFNGVVVLPEGGFPTFAHFEYSADGVTWTSVPAEEEVSLGTGSGAGSAETCPTGNPPSCNVKQTAVGLAPNTAYEVRLVASAGTPTASSVVTFKTTAAPPSISTTVAEPVAETSATLTGYVNPNAQSTTYHFEWGADTSYGTRIPVDFEAVAGSGGAPIKVSANVSGLQPHSTYHFRLVATNASGTTNGADQSFNTLDASGLPDNRGYELVSPADKRPQGAVSAVLVATFLQFQASADGQSVLFPLAGGTSDTNSGGDATYLATRSPSGWQSTKVSPPSLVPAPTNGLLGNGSAGNVVYYSRDLSCGIVDTFNPLTADTPPADVELGTDNLYRRNDDGTYTLITDQVPSNPELAPIGPTGLTPYTVAGVSPDCSRVYFKSGYNLLPNPSGLYEWDNGVLRDAGRLPNGATPTPACTAIGGEFAGCSTVAIGGARVHAVSTDGSRFFFSAISNESGNSGKEAVFVRKNGAAAVDVTKKQGGANDSLGARYETASADGSHVFFIAGYGLTPASSAGSPENCSNTEIGSLVACDLYDYNVDTGALKDLSADSNAADTKGAVVQGVVAASDDGSSVYFAARGQLVPGKGKSYAQNTVGAGSANLYLAHAGQLTYVATVTASDMTTSSQSPLMKREAQWSAEATPDGGRLLFASLANITGYNSGGVPEAYLYSAASGTTVCVSCRTDGQPSVGVAQEHQPLTGSVRQSPNLLASLRMMSDDGNRIFFTSRDVLAPGAVSGNTNIYEWEGRQVYLLLTGSGASPLAIGTDLYGASASGDDVFIHTTTALDPHDVDFVEDIYDVRVGGGFPAPAAAPMPCDPAADQCQGTPGTAPATSGPATSAAAGPGNPPLAPVKKPHHKKPHRKHHKKAPSRRHNRATDNNRGGAK